MDLKRSCYVFKQNSKDTLVLLGWEIELFLMCRLSSGQTFLKVKGDFSRDQRHAARSALPLVLVHIKGVSTEPFVKISESSKGACYSF